MKTKHHFMRQPLPGVDYARLSGRLIVIEGPDGSGRSTQISLLGRALEEAGHHVVVTGLRRSRLVARALDEAKEGNVLSPRTRSLFYATDFYDQLENVVVPALRSGAIVLADRYVYSLMARDLVRGADQQWLEALYGMAIQPDAVFYLQTAPAHLEERIFESHGSLDYWESGMDLGLSRDWHESFVKYQHRMRQAFKTLQKRFGFETLNGNRLPSTIQRDLRTRTTAILDPPPVPLTPERTADDVSLMPAEVRMQ